MTDFRVAVIGVFAALSLALPLFAESPSSSAGTKTETIVYTTLRPPNWDVFLFREGSDKGRRLTNHKALDYNATFSPDGKWVVFTSERNGSADLFALQLETNALHQLTADRAMDDAASFSPDGRWIAFVSTRTGSPEIFKMMFRPGKTVAKAVNLTNSPGNDLNPAFSPDGKQIAFSSNRALKDRYSNAAGLYVMNADGSQTRQVKTSKRVDGSPAWSLDGQRLYFNSFGFSASPKPSRLYSVGVDGTGFQEHSRSKGSSFACTVRTDGTIAWTQSADSSTAWNGASFSIEAAQAGQWSKVSTLREGYLRPQFDKSGKRMLCHGPGPLEGLSLMPNGNPFARPGADRIVELPDRKVRLRGVRAYFPSLSPDGKTIVAVPWLHSRHGRPAGPSPVVRFNLDGTNAKTILPAGKDTIWATRLSRNGSLFYCTGPPMAKRTARVNLWNARVDGTQARKLAANSPANDAFPDVSADGSKVVFRSGRESGFQIYMFDVKKGRTRRITNGRGRHTMPAISPDGDQLVYSSQVGFFGSEGFRLFVKSLKQIDAPARLLEPELMDLKRADMHARFSPDGQWIVFTSSRGGLQDDWQNCGFYPQPYGDLWALPLDGRCPAIRLTDDKWEDGLADWGR